ncbi:MAG: hypothetical protein GX947_02485 [Tissierellia bacterium]|nr:hypothetical protein [Tissierellia bacterium]
MIVHDYFNRYKNFVEGLTQKEKSKIIDKLERLQAFCPKFPYRRVNRRKYAMYLQSERWQKKVRYLLAKHVKCQCCGYDRDLVIHHKTYKNIFEEQEKDLTVLCHHCHNRVHNSN